MESKATNRNPKWRKRTKLAQIPSDSIQDLNLIIPIFPLELIDEILLRVPVKSLLKFRCVSKSWLALISSPEFIKNHLNLSANNKNKKSTHHMLFLSLNLSGDKWNFKECPLRSVFYDSVVGVETFNLDYPIENASKDISIVGFCNGLIFLAHHSEYSLLWNPTTRKHKNLLDFKSRWKKNGAVYDFGYDEFRDDYKIVGIFHDHGGSDGVEVKIYSLKSDSWTSVDYGEEILNASGSYRKMRTSAPGLFANGKLYWDTLTAGPRLSYVCTGKNIISFDLANEK